MSHILVHYVVTAKQQPYGCRKAESAVRAVGGEALIAGVCLKASGQVVHVRKGVQAEYLVAYDHLFGIELHILQRGGISLREAEVTLQYAGTLCRADDIVRGEAFEGDEPRVVHDLYELVYALEKSRYGITVLDLAGNDVAPAKDREVALLAAALARGLGDVEVGGMVQKGPLVKVQLIASVQRAGLRVVQPGPVRLLFEPVLAVYDRVVRQYAYRLGSCRMDRLVLLRGDGEQLGQAYPEADGDVGVFGEDTALLNGQYGKFTL